MDRMITGQAPFRQNSAQFATVDLTAAAPAAVEWS
jgi:hypothetical protein